MRLQIADNYAHAFAVARKVTHIQELKLQRRAAKFVINYQIVVLILTLELKAQVSEGLDQRQLVGALGVVRRLRVLLLLAYNRVATGENHQSIEQALVVRIALVRQHILNELIVVLLVGLSNYIAPASSQNATQQHYVLCERTRLVRKQIVHLSEIIVHV